LRGGGVFLERNEVLRLGAELHAQVENEIVDRARRLEVGVHGLLGGAHAVLGDTAVVAGEQHRPFGKRHEDRLIDLELHRQFDLALGRVEARGVHVFFQVAEDLRRLIVVESRAFEIGRQRHHQLVCLAVRRADRLRIRAVERDGLGIEAVPNRASV